MSSLVIRITFIQPLPLLLAPSAIWSPGPQMLPALPGKRVSQPLVVSATGHPQSCLFFVTERMSGLYFLMDTGAEVSILPASQVSCSSLPAGPPLQVANNSSITTFGMTSHTLSLRFHRTFHWIFLIVDAMNPILGADFLWHFNLLVDIYQGCPSDSLTQLQTNGMLTEEVSSSPCVSHSSAASDSFFALLQEFSALISPVPRNTPIQHDMVHHITITGPQVHARPRRLPPEHLQVAKQEFEHMLDFWARLFRPGGAAQAAQAMA